jgi:predicted metal-dependent hydrolase
MLRCKLRMIEPREIVRRRVAIDFDSAPQDRWLKGGGMFEPFLDVLSHFLPRGERFVIDTMRHYIENIKDPALTEQVQRFIYQEALHSKLHIESNKSLAKWVDRTASVPRFANFGFDLAWKYAPRAFCLSLTCAAEHWTTVVAETVLQDQNAFRRAVDPAFGQLWLWHAAEETEHKGVTIDVYDAVLGRGPIAYLNRVTGFVTFSFFFLANLLNGLRLVRAWRRLATLPRATEESQPAWLYERRLRHLLPKVCPWRRLLAYFRPSFHPWDHDSRHLIEQWKQNYPCSTNG